MGRGERSFLLFVFDRVGVGERWWCFEWVFGVGFCGGWGAFG